MSRLAYHTELFASTCARPQSLWLMTCVTNTYQTFRCHCQLRNTCVCLSLTVHIKLCDFNVIPITKMWMVNDTLIHIINTASGQDLGLGKLGIVALGPPQPGMGVGGASTYVLSPFIVFGILGYSTTEGCPVASTCLNPALHCIPNSHFCYLFLKKMGAIWSRGVITWMICSRSEFHSC